VDETLHLHLRPLAAVFIGTMGGWVVQTVASRLRYDAEWPDFPRGYRAALDATGAIAALFVGLLVLDADGGVTLPRLWAWQIAAAWSGATVLDAGARFIEWLVRKFTGRNGK